VSRWNRQTWPVEKLRQLAEEVAGATEGERHRKLYAAAAECGHYVADGTLEAARIEHELITAAERAGLAADRASEVRRTISTALAKGKAERAWYPSAGGAASRSTVQWGGRVYRLATGKPVLEAAQLADIELPVTECPATVRITWYPALRETRGEGSEWEWSELAEAVSEPVEWPGGKQAVALWSFAEIEGDDRGRRRGEDGRDRDPETYRIHGLVLDYDDDETWSIGQVEAWWGAVQYVAHSSASHLIEKDGKPAHGRGRVMLALSRPVTVEEYGRIAEWVLHCGRGVIGQAEIRATRRAYFVPTRAPGGYESGTNMNGQALDVDALLERLDGAEAEALDGEEVPDPEVWAKLAKIPKGDAFLARDTVRNVEIILELDPRWKGRLRWSEFRGRPELDGRAVRDEDETEIVSWIERVYGLCTSTARVHEVMRMVCARNGYHEVREELERLVWDGKPRLATWMSDYCGIERDPADPDLDSNQPTPLTAIYGTRWMIAAVARVYVPGCKVDNVLVWKGGQGIGKSTCLRVLCGSSRFSDSALSIGDKDGYQALVGVHIYELSELDSVRRTDWSAVKAFLSAQVDKYRPSYGRNLIEVPRQVVFAGSTNEATFLGDATGSRRFWVRKVVAPADPSGLAKVREQLWAEAVHRFKQGERWWLTTEEETARAEDAEHYRIVDPWEEPIIKYLGSRTDTTVSEVLEQALDRKAADATKGDEMRVSAILAGLGWWKGRVVGMTGKRVMRWNRP
jgi:predicted P-loop ATPase